MIVNPLTRQVLVLNHPGHADQQDHDPTGGSGKSEESQPELDNNGQGFHRKEAKSYVDYYRKKGKNPHMRLMNVKGKERFKISFD